MFVNDSDPPKKPPAAEQAAAPEVAPAADPDDPHTWQTSDQVPGEIAPPLVPGQRVVLSRTQRFSYQAAPGVTVTGVARAGPSAARCATSSCASSGGRPASRSTSRTASDPPAAARHRHAATDPKGVVAGINGDFYDISDTGAPLGIGRERGGLLWNAIDLGWNNALSVNTEGKWHVGELPMVAEVVRHPEIVVTNYNSPRVKVGGTGIYDYRFGRAAGLGWTDGQRRQIRAVKIVDGEVVSNTHDTPATTPASSAPPHRARRQAPRTSCGR